MAGDDDVRLPPIERPATAEPVERASRDPERRKKQERGKPKREETESESTPEEGKGERIDIRA